jgi:hypothetical protein
MVAACGSDIVPDERRAEAIRTATAACDDDEDDDRGHHHRDHLVVSRVRYDGNTFGSAETYPRIFADPSVSGIQGSVHIDRFVVSGDHAERTSSRRLENITTSFSSKSEGALMLSVDGSFLSYMGYAGPVGAEGVSNSYTTGAPLPGNTAPLFDRAVALIEADGSTSVTDESNAYSGDNPRAAITVDGTQLYMAGNADSTIAPDGSGPGTTIGARYGMPGSSTSIELGVYFAGDRPEETKKQHVKDSNFRGIGIYGGNLYVSKGSGGNGDDGVFQVGVGLPTTTGNPITKLLGDQATNPATQAASPLTPFGFWFADASTLYVADEGYANTDASGKLQVDPMAGLQKWTLVNGAWTLAYVIQAGLDLAQPKTVHGYPVPTATTGIRNMTGKLAHGGKRVTVYAITAQNSSISSGEPDPTNLVVVHDDLAATILPRHDRFETIAGSGIRHVFRGVAFAPKGDTDGDGDDTGSISVVGVVGP